MDNNLFVDVINQIKVILGMEKVQVKFNEDVLKDGTIFYFPDEVEFMEGLEVYSDPELTTPLADGTYEMVEKSFDVVGGLITKITEAIETPETPETEVEPETEVQEDMISELTAQIELLKDENEKLKKICADYEIDITNLKSDIEKFKSNEFKMKKEIEKLGNEPEVKSLNRINLASEIKKGSLSSFNDTRNFLKSIVE